MTVVELAAQYLELFDQITRDNGDVVWVWKQNITIPQELVDLAQTAHDGMMPDDYKYEYIVDSLALISEAEDNDYLYELDSNLEPDVYNRDLLIWLSSNLNRAEYIDAYVQEYCGGSISSSDFDFYSLIRNGQWLEKQEVFHSVLSSLQSIVDNE
jgi:hypothetical protein